MVGGGQETPSIQAGTSFFPQHQGGSTKGEGFDGKHDGKIGKCTGDNSCFVSGFAKHFFFPPGSDLGGNNSTRVGLLRFR